MFTSPASRRVTRRAVLQALERTALAVEELDSGFGSLNSDVGLIAANQTTADTVLCEHDRRLEAVCRELETVKQQLSQLSRRGEPAAPAPSPTAARGLGVGHPAPPVTTVGASRVSPSDVEAFLAAIPVPPADDGELASAVRTVLGAVRRTLAVEAEDLTRFPWAGPLLLLCSASVDRTAAFLALLKSHGPGCELSVIGRDRDRAAVLERWGHAFRFYRYEAPGVYDVARAPRVPGGTRFGALVFLDGSGLRGDRMGHCAALLRNIQAEPVFCFGTDGNLYAVSTSEARLRAERAVTGLLTWYNDRLAL